jgi:hypothetical protein
MVCRRGFGRGFRWFCSGFGPLKDTDLPNEPAVEVLVSTDGFAGLEVAPIVLSDPRDLEFRAGCRMDGICTLERQTSRSERPIQVAVGRAAIRAGKAFRLKVVITVPDNTHMNLSCLVAGVKTLEWSQAVTVDEYSPNDRRDLIYLVYPVTAGTNGSETFFDDLIVNAPRPS